MATFKNVSGHRIEIPLFDLRVDDGDTFEVPDEAAAQFTANPWFKDSRTQNPTVTPGPALTQSFTGPVPVADTATPAN